MSKETQNNHGNLDFEDGDFCDLFIWFINKMNCCSRYVISKEKRVSRCQIHLNSISFVPVKLKVINHFLKIALHNKKWKKKKCCCFYQQIDFYQISISWALHFTFNSSNLKVPTPFRYTYIPHTFARKWKSVNSLTKKETFSLLLKNLG